ncbi:MAG: phospho-N-acetylmuramoyl-pentapeptide-transferase [Phycisphaeraceae bacterium]|nr:phospho-N-acetylmuramoyl-pentapeptide-transferase [Phycisphaeraceae bacterium]MCW5754025.1 phospho-N-acetylmuramoyl-pentapeptide-transferase [Phycisphaeraceae bacterium]
MLYLLLDKLRPWLVEVGLYRYLQILDQVEFRALSAAVIAFVLVLAFGRRTIRFLVGLKIGDAGVSDAEALRSVTAGKKNTPTMGGILIAGAILVAVLLLADLTAFSVKLGILVLVWMAAIGGADDWLKLTAARRGTGRQGLYGWEKLVFQIGIGLLVGWFLWGQPGDMGNVVNLPFQKTYEAGEPAPDLFYFTRIEFLLVAVLMLAGMSNAVNITDGMDGLAAGNTAIVAFGVVVLGLIAGSSSTAKLLLVPWVPGGDEMAVLAGAMAGACLGFLWWNCAPAHVFMGDTGSLCLGGLLGYFAIVLRQEAVILIMCGVFLIEITSVVLQVAYFKRTGGKRIFKCAPIHHHFHLSGWTENQVVVRAYIVTIFLVIASLASIKVR